jgi:sulfotransferase
LQAAIHFISGLPRAGSTLLSAILRQNPRFRAGMTGLYPDARVICCVRDVPWIFDSIERLIRKNKLQPSGILNFEPGGTVYSRVDGLGGPNGMVGYAWNALREAFCGEQSDRLLALTYETLTGDPAKAIAAVYDFLRA